jgi:hypothetical protein
VAGKNYAVDSIYCFCLELQKYFYGGNRKDNILIDPGYHMLGQELNKIL